MLKSNTGNNFENIGTVNGAGNSLQAINYSFTDENPSNGINYYQLQQTDFNGQTTFSKVIAVNNSSDEVNLIIISPNPVHDFIQFSFAQIENNYEAQIINTFGQTIIQTQNQNKIDVSQLSNGIYFIKIKERDNFYLHKFLKQ